MMTNFLEALHAHPIKLLFKEEFAQSDFLKKALWLFTFFTAHLLTLYFSSNHSEECAASPAQYPKVSSAAQYKDASELKLVGRWVFFFVVAVNEYHSKVSDFVLKRPHCETNATTNQRFRTTSFLLRADNIISNKPRCWLFLTQVIRTSILSQRMHISWASSCCSVFLNGLLNNNKIHFCK